MAGMITFIVVFAVGLLVAVPVTILNAWVLSVMWGWFVVPTFDLPQLSILVSIGLCSIVGFLTYQTTNDTGKSDKAKIMDFVGVFTRPLFVFLFGYIVHSMM